MFNIFFFNFNALLGCVYCSFLGEQLDHCFKFRDTLLIIANVIAILSYVSKCFVHLFIARLYFYLDQNGYFLEDFFLGP